MKTCALVTVCFGLTLVCNSSPAGQLTISTDSSRPFYTNDKFFQIGSTLLSDPTNQRYWASTIKVPASGGLLSLGFNAFSIPTARPGIAATANANSSRSILSSGGTARQHVALTTGCTYDSGTMDITLNVDTSSSTDATHIGVPNISTNYLVVYVGASVSSTQCPTDPTDVIAWSGNAGSISSYGSSSFDTYGSVSSSNCVLVVTNDGPDGSGVLPEAWETGVVTVDGSNNCSVYITN